MKWTIIDIDKEEYCKKQLMPGEPEMVVVTLENEIGQETEMEVAQRWLDLQELSEGDEWPQELDEMSDQEVSYIQQAQWMDNYLHALDEMDAEDE